MAIDNDNHDVKQAEERKRVAKEQQKQQQQKDPMRTFEAKLSEKASHEEGTRESMRKTSEQLEQDMQRKGELLKKIIGSDSKDAADLNTKAKEHEQAFEQQKRAEKKTFVSEEKKEDIEEKSEQKAQGDAELSETKENTEGHRRIESEEGQGDSESGSGGSDGGADSEGDNMGGGDFGSRDQDSSNTPGQGFVMPTQGFDAAADTDSGSGSGSGNMSDEELDQIVAAVQHGFLDNGEEFFGVEMTNDFYEGLKIQSQRTDAGIVLTLICPNVLVRSQMAKVKEQILARFEEKNIVVAEVKVQ